LRCDIEQNSWADNGERRKTWAAVATGRVGLAGLNPFDAPAHPGVPHGHRIEGREEIRAGGETTS
jgi:hypothetical protein